MKEIFKYVAKKWYIIIIILCLLGTSLWIELVSPNLTRKIIDEGIMQNNIVRVQSVGIQFLFYSIISLTAVLLYGFISAFFYNSFLSNLITRTYKKLEKKSVAELNEIKTSSIVTRLTKDTITSVEVLSNMISMVFFPIEFVVAMYISMKIDAKLTLNLLYVLPFIFVLGFAFGKISNKIFKKLKKHQDKLNRTIKENISAMRVVKLFNLQQDQKKEFDKQNKSITKITIDVVKIIIITEPVIFSVILLGFIKTLWDGNVRINNGTLTIGSLIAIISYMSIMINSSARFSMLLVSIFKSLVSVNRVAEVLENDEKSTDLLEKKKEVILDNFDIEFKNVSFRYENKNVNALENISFKIKEGEKVGIIGISGSSKTTILDILMKIFDNYTGDIYIGKNNIKDIDKEEIREKIAYAPQNNVLFSGSIRENILLTNNENNNISDEQIYNALKTTLAYEFVEKFPEKLDKDIYAEGLNLSGGQKQRLALARVILKNAEIYIFDDSTSAVDVITEAKIWRNLLEKYKDKTIICISQRIKTIQKMDKIIVMSKGKVESIGDEKYLLKNSKVYKEIFELQKNDRRD